MRIATASLNDWEQTLAGAGVITEFEYGSVLNAPDAAADNAYLRKNVVADPGVTYTLTVVARLQSGTAGTAAKLAIDYPEEKSLKQSLEIDSTYFKSYSLSYTVPMTAARDAILSFVVGMYTGLAGNVIITDVQIDADVIGPRLYLAAFINMGSGNPTVNGNFVNVGLREVDYDAASKTMTVTMRKSAPDGCAPLVTAELDGTTATASLVAKVQSYDRDAGTFEVKFYDMSLATPAPVDVSGVVIYLKLQAIGA